MSSFQIFEDQENEVPNAPRRVKGEDLKPIQNRGKRTVLGALNIVKSNANLRVQPSRAAKPKQVLSDNGISSKVQKENLVKHCKEPTHFSIQKDVASISLESKDYEDSSWGSNSSCISKIVESETSFKNEDEEKFHTSFTGLHRLENNARSCCSVHNMSISDSSVKLPCFSHEDILSCRDGLYDVDEYLSDIYSYLKEAEVLHKPKSNYMQRQTDITASMRWILVDWLVEVSEEYNLHTETLYLAVSYIDRFLSHMSVKRDKLQLVGTTAMFIAAKFEEIYPPDVSQFAYITDNTYKVSQILRMEHLILKVLSFDMAVPTPYFFVKCFAKLCNASEETLHLALFFSELSLLDCDPFMRFLPSLIAASAVALANYTKDLPAWPQKISESTGYKIEELQECYINLHKVFLHVHEPNQHAIRDKYKQSKWHSVSLLSPRSSFPWQ